jgi:hypothetical protein
VADVSVPERARARRLPAEPRLLAAALAHRYAVEAVLDVEPAHGGGRDRAGLEPAVRDERPQDERHRRGAVHAPDVEQELALLGGELLRVAAVAARRGPERSEPAGAVGVPWASQAGQRPGRASSTVGGRASQTLTWTSVCTTRLLLRSPADTGPGHGGGRADTRSPPPVSGADDAPVPPPRRRRYHHDRDCQFPDCAMAVAVVTRHSPSRSLREIGRYAVILADRQHLQPLSIVVHSDELTRRSPQDGTRTSLGALVRPDGAAMRAIRMRNISIPSEARP